LSTIDGAEKGEKNGNYRHSQPDCPAGGARSYGGTLREMTESLSDARRISPRPPIRYVDGLPLTSVE